MKLKEIAAQGFKCFNKPESFNFELESGLYYLTGDNQVEPALGANGVGKSSLFDAWTYLLFAKTARGLKAGDVYAWKSKLLCKLEGKFYLGEDLYTLKRTWNPNTLELKKNEGDFEEVTQDQLEKLVEFTFDSWLAAVLMDQQGAKFMDMSAPDKTAMFSTILGLDYWLECSKRAGEKATFLWDILRDTENFQSKIEGQLEEARGRSFEESIAKWKATHEKEVQALKDEIVVARKDAAKQKKEIEKLDKRLAELQEEKADLKVHLKQKQEKKDDVGEKLSKIEAEMAVLEKGIADTEKKIVKWDKLGGTCSNCNQPIDAKHKKKEITLLEKQKESLEKELDDKESLYLKAGKVFTSVKGQIAQLREVIDEMDFQAATLTKNRATFEAEAKMLMKDSIRLRRRYEEAREESNPYVQEKLDHERRINDLEASLEAQKKDVNNTRAQHDAAKFWVKGFKEVRFHLIKEALLQFEIEVNSSLQSLGLGDWKMSFAMDEENKSGTIKKGFAVSVQSPHNKEKVKWEAWSGGEGQRLRLAASMGLINLILSRRSYETNIEIWDEPTQYLSEKGVYDLLDTISNRAELLGKQIWIVDHRTLCYANFKRSFKMVKTKEGSKLEEFI